MQNGDDGLPNIILDGRSLLVKMLIILNQHGIVKSNFAYFYILTLLRPRYTFETCVKAVYITFASIY